VNGFYPSTPLQIEEEANGKRHQKDDCDNPGGMYENELADIAPVLRSKQRQLAQSPGVEAKKAVVLSKPQKRVKNAWPVRVMNTMNETSGIIASHQSSMERGTSAVKALPTMTPMMGRAALRAALGNFQSRPATEIMAAAVSDPSVQGSGKPNSLKRTPPTHPEAKPKMGRPTVLLASVLNIPERQLPDSNGVVSPSASVA
jgi:hypothetical protein